MEFIPDDHEPEALDIPYVDELRKVDGWRGHTTTKSYETLKTDVTNAISKLGGVVHSIQRGAFKINNIERPGVVVHYTLEGPDGKMAYGRFDMAGPPFKTVTHVGEHTKTHREQTRARRDQSVRVGLYNVVEALKSQWVLKQLNPAYAPLMPWLLADGKNTITERFTAAGVGNIQLPEPKNDEDDVITGEFTESD